MMVSYVIILYGDLFMTDTSLLYAFWIAYMDDYRDFNTWWEKADNKRSDLITIWEYTYHRYFNTLETLDDKS